MGDDEFHRVLLNRFQDLEASHAKLTEQLDVLKEEKEIEEVRRRKEGSLYGRILQSMGHAVYVTEASDGNIIYWNHSAESLFGWKDYEAVGQKATDLMIEEPNHASIKKIVGMLNTGQSWSGQFPFKKRSGEIFMGLVTKSLLYEDSELFGVITVSSDAAIFSSINSEKIRTYQDHAYSQPRERKFNMKKILTPQIVSVPQLSSSVSNLASKVFSRQNGEDDPSIECARTRSQGEPAVEIFDSESQKESKQSFRLRMRKNSADGNTINKEESILGFVQPSKIAAKVLEKLEKLQIGGNSNDVQEEFKSGAPCASAETQVSNTAVLDPNFTRLSRETSLTNHNNGMMNTLSDAELNSVSAIKRESTAESGTELHHESKDSHATKKDLFVASWLECREYSGMPNSGIPLTSLALEHEEKEELQPNNRNVNEALEAHASEPQNLQVTPSPKLLSSAESSGSLGSSHEKLSSGDKELDLIVVDCGIPWEELQLYDEIGNGSFAVVYRGAWNGSDVAIKVYFASEVGETNLMDYKKEIAIMKRLRHPNVLLFMGAVYSPERPAIVTELLPRCQSPVSPIHRSNILSERPAIVTELLPRGSLFKTLHRNNHGLDIKRRLRMALDVARGVNYLHRRNPPIVHRDLKSSNLLVDRNWTVKVGDFGLSKWKNATYLTAKSGRGTPQWMAPEVLRNEPSNEKSDVYSFGVILWELLTESIPWTNLNALQVVGAVGFMDRRLDLPNNLDPRLSSVIHDCWKSDPESRPSFHDLIHIMADLIQTFPSVPIRRKLEA